MSVIKTSLAFKPEVILLIGIVRQTPKHSILISLNTFEAISHDSWQDQNVTVINWSVNMNKLVTFSENIQETI